MRNKSGNRISLFNFLVILFLGAGTIVFLVNNIIRVNTLAVDNNNIKEEINKTTNINNGLNTEIERITTFDNIKTTAIDKLKLNVSLGKPKKITINKSELENLD